MSSSPSLKVRSFWHIFKSFDRMWGFFILCLQAMIIVAWNGSGNPSAIFNGDVFKKVLSVFITAVILKLGQATLDVILSWKEREGELEKRELTTISSCPLSPVLLLHSQI
ncbi:callose synthase 1-like isoform X2 [Arachis hypogaea]|uniref:callose synthase 1-like isoform X2 n=1 Tax=Arachis hypogaea TaxID=3818 RepID=UPI000DED6DD9|nr:callose synthase 1-like isoform X2 [Arachis hypogaea]